MDKGTCLFTLPFSKITGAAAPTLLLAGSLKSMGWRVVLLCRGGRVAREAKARGLDVAGLSPLTIVKWGRDARVIVASRSQDHLWALLLWGGARPVFRLWYKPSPPGDYLWDRFLVPFTRGFLSPFPLDLGRRERWLPGGVDIRAFRPGERLAGGMRVVMVARMKAGRGQEELLRALEGLEAPLTVTFVGAGETLDWVKSLARSLVGEERCRFVEEKMEDYAPFLREHHLLVYLSLGSEATARTVLEAMASGLVVLSGAGGGVPHYLGRWNPPLKDGMLREALWDYAWAPGKRRRVGLLNAVRARRFSSEARGERFGTAVADLLGDGAR